MSSEVCPFCGKTYKRLKSHLPHCKAAAGSKTPPTKHDITVNQKSTSSSQLAAALIHPLAKGGKSTQTLSMTASPEVKSKKVSAVSSAQPPSSSTDTSLQSASSSQSLSPSSASPTPSTKRKKQKLSEQIKTATISLISTQSQSPSLPPTISKLKTKSLRDLIEASKSKQVSEESVEGTRSASEDLPSGSTPYVADRLNSRTATQTETQTSPETDNTHPALLSTDTKPKGATPSNMKASKKKKAAQSVSVTEDTSSSLDSKVNEKNARPSVRDDCSVGEEQIEDLSVNKMLSKSGSGQARITLQGVKAVLGRTNSTRQSSRPNILSQIGTTDDLRSKFRPVTELSPILLPTGNRVDVDNLVTSKTLSGQLPSTSAQHTELQSVKKKSSKPKKAPLISNRRDGSPQPELTSPETSRLPGHLLPQVSRAKSLPPTVRVNEGLNVGHHVTRLPTTSPSPNQFSSPHLFPLGPQTLPARVETLRADDGMSMEKSQLEVRKRNTADNESKGSLEQRSLGQVRLRELPEWLACKTPRDPRDLVEMVQRGWQWYYKRYTDVKKGGVGGLGMLLAGYCVLSFIWSYPHIKRDRWRKYH